MTTAALGGQFEVATLDGTQTRVKVPEGTQNGRQFRLKGKGMPVLRQPQVGNLYTSRSRSRPRRTFPSASANCSRSSRNCPRRENSPQSSGFFSRMKDFFESFGE